MPKVLNLEEINEGLSGWKIENDKIERIFELKDFKAAIEFVNKVAMEAESANHHPEIEINFDKVEIELTTHSEGGVTEKDIELAKKIEGVYGSN
jgi:4a-hydroxytetrahydrobiopterin dehydratase